MIGMHMVQKIGSFVSFGGLGDPNRLDHRHFGSKVWIGSHKYKKFQCKTCGCCKCRCETYNVLVLYHFGKPQLSNNLEKHGKHY